MHICRLLTISKATALYIAIMRWRIVKNSFCDISLRYLSFFFLLETNAEVPK